MGNEERVSPTKGYRVLEHKPPKKSVLEGIKGMAIVDDQEELPALSDLLQDWSGELLDDSSGSKNELLWSTNPLQPRKLLLNRPIVNISRIQQLDCCSETTHTAESTEAPKVRFSTITIREYPRILDDNPACSSGPAFSIDWCYYQHPPGPPTRLWTRPTTTTTTMTTQFAKKIRANNAKPGCNHGDIMIRKLLQRRDEPIICDRIDNNPDLIVWIVWDGGAANGCHNQVIIIFFECEIGRLVVQSRPPPVDITSIANRKLDRERRIFSRE